MLLNHSTAVVPFAVHSFPDSDKRVGLLWKRVLWQGRCEFRGKMLGLDYSSVSVARRRWREGMERGRGLAGLAGRVEAAIVFQE